MTAKFNGRCRGCGDSIRAGDQIVHTGRKRSYHERCYGNTPVSESTSFFDEDGSLRQQRFDDAEYARGYNETALAQQAGPPGSAAREAAYAALEQRWYDEGY